MEGDPTPFPILSMDRFITTVVPSKASVFKSSTAPFLLCYNTTDADRQYKLIFKNGDDLRMDQLIM